MVILYIRKRDSLFPNPEDFRLTKFDIFEMYGHLFQVFFHGDDRSDRDRSDQRVGLVAGALIIIRTPLRGTIKNIGPKRMHFLIISIQVRVVHGATCASNESKYCNDFLVRNLWPDDQVSVFV